MAALLIGRYVLGVIASSPISVGAPDEQRKSVVLAGVTLTLAIAVMLGRSKGSEAAAAMAIAKGVPTPSFSATAKSESA